jgi:intracellular multiplication protein IcmS
MDVDKLVLIAKAMDVQFSLNNNSITPADALSTTGLLPAICRRADQLCSLCLGYGLGVSFEEAEGTVLGMKVVFDQVTPDVLRYLCITDVLSEIVKNATNNGVTKLDELLYD